MHPEQNGCELRPSTSMGAETTIILSLTLKRCPRGRSRVASAGARLDGIDVCIAMSVEFVPTTSRATHAARLGLALMFQLYPRQLFLSVKR